MKKNKKFKVKRYNKQNNNLTYYEDYAINKIRTKRLQEYGVLSLLGLLGIMFLISGDENILTEIEIDQNNIMNTIGIGLTSGSVVGSIANVLRNGDRGDDLRRLKKRREEIIEMYYNSKKRK